MMGKFNNLISENSSKMCLYLEKNSLIENNLETF